ncbi:MAG: prolipoprotein diacylglyceryl transferase [Clostridia bacterium]|nr:prolipoprotein diacylglyceryl transferase [Clostridia bacterium]
MTNTIAFPGIGIGPMTIPTEFTFFGVSIHWYGVLIALGVVLAYFFCKRKAKPRGISDDTLLDILIWGLPTSIIFARIYYVIFSWQDYANDFWGVFRIWEGGSAIYGAVIGACLSTLFYCRVKKLSFPVIADIGSFGLLIGQIIGRWGNFVNAEAYGGHTQTALFRMEIVNRGITVHPTFLYESAWNILVFILINVFEKYQKFKGEIFLWYLTGYGLGRFFIEGMREDSLWLGTFRISQVLAAICFVVGLTLVVYFRRKNGKEIKEAL